MHSSAATLFLVGLLFASHHVDGQPDPRGELDPRGKPDAAGPAGEGARTSVGCASNPCYNDGKCIPANTAGGFTCLCPCFLAGTLCEFIPLMLNPMHPCESNPCQNGGSCYCHSFRTTCTCPDGVKGDNCEITAVPTCGFQNTSEPGYYEPIVNYGCVYVVDAEALKNVSSTFNICRGHCNRPTSTNDISYECRTTGEITSTENIKYKLVWNRAGKECPEETEVEMNSYTACDCGWVNIYE